MEKHLVRLVPLGKQIHVNDQTQLMDVLHPFGIEFPCGGNGTCGKCKVRLLSGEIEISEFHRRKLNELNLSPDWRLACFSRCTSDITLEVEQFNHLILADETEFAFIPQEGFGVAIDLGTTTIVAQLIDLKTAHVVAAETLLNPQVRFGADLISRIQACLDGHAAEMSTMIRIAIGQMVARMLEKHPVEICKAVLVGNSAMQLIFAGNDVTTLASYPFENHNPGLKHFSATELSWNFGVLEGVTFYPSIGSFVGSDILAGIAATGIHKSENYSALIDLGTNGEIVLGNKNRLVCASTAAGPAFEGANISMGMRAVTGAISSLRLNGNSFEPSVIGNTAPKGICGSGLIDAVAILRKLDRIGMFGEINSGETEIHLAGKVKLSQKDIHEFLLAKAAIAAGLTILARELGIEVSHISELYIAGGFGNYLNVENLVATGMIELPKERIHKIGNTALIGAKMFLFADARLSGEILGKTRHINLEGDPDFQEIFVDKMLL